LISAYDKASSSKSNYFNNTSYSMMIHLIDGTYELFRHFYGLRSFNKDKDKPFGALVGVLNGVMERIEKGATHLGVATDHVIESFRNKLWSEYKTGQGIDPVLFAQFHPLEEALALMGVAVWPMIELEADDALASAAHLAAANPEVEKVCIWTPDKDLAQCVRDDRVVQIDSRAKSIRDEEAIIKKFGVSPVLIPDYLALVGDSADGYPGISGIGKTGAARMLNHYGPIEDFPPEVLGQQRQQALLFKRLATLITNELLFRDVKELQWHGPTAAFAEFTTKIGEPALLERAKAAAAKVIDIV
jgi:5'-3' exonuclease